MAVPLAYVSGALGPTPSTPLQTTNGEVRWNRHDRKVRMVPDKDAASILRSNPADFAACVFVEEGYGGLSAEDLRELATTGSLTVEQYTPKGGSDAVDVLVLDAKTLRAVAEFNAARPEMRELLAGANAGRDGVEILPPRAPTAGEIAHGRRLAEEEE